MTEEGLLVATTNSGKIREISRYLSGLPFQIKSLREAGLTVSFEEKGATFLENARGKSLFFSKFWKGLTLAEDSGLEIEYLDGAPGVYSARFSGPRSSDESNIQKVLSLLKGVPQEKRRARFVSCMVLSKKENPIKEFEEIVEGIILPEKRGEFGFGYDPIFFFPTLGKTFAEIPPDEKNKVSHRGKVLRKVKEFFDKNLESLRGASNV